MAAKAGALDINSEPISTFQRFLSPEQFGPFAWRGGLTLTSDAQAFGGLSGLVITGNCEELLAVSDGGNWLQARLAYEDGRLSGLTASRMMPILDSRGQRPGGGIKADAETLVPLGKGKVGIAFERRVRFGAYNLAKNGLAAPLVPIPHPRAIDMGPENGEVEAFGLLQDGRHIALAERSHDIGGKIRGWAWGKATTAATAFYLARHGAYDVTDLVVTAQGDVLTLERRISETSLPGMAIRRFPASAIASERVIEPELLLEASAPLYIIDNMEGMALCTRNGETRITLVSDDNFNRVIQSTIVLQFAYRP